LSSLLDEIIADRKAKAIEYEEYLKRIAALAQQVNAGYAEDVPDQLKKSPALRALYNNLQTNGTMSASIAAAATSAAQHAAAAHGDNPALDLALLIDETVKRVRPDAWRGVETRERVVKAALYGILKDVAEVERLFLIIKAQREY